jgi:hypothetical protein
MKVVALLAIPFPPLLDAITLKTVMNFVVSNGMVGVNKLCHLFFSPLQTHGLSYQVIEGVV